MDEQKQKHEDYKFIFNVRAEEQSTNNEQTEKILIGKAVPFNEKQKLFDVDGLDYFEIIDRHAFDEADMSDIFLKYGHVDAQMVFARSKNETLKYEIRDDGLWLEIHLPNTTNANDLYELVKNGTLDKLSIGFSIAEQGYDEIERTWTVYKIKKLYEVSVVPHPAYENTSLFVKRAKDVEAKLAEMEFSKQKARAIQLLVATKI